MPLIVSKYFNEWKQYYSDLVNVVESKEARLHMRPSGITVPLHTTLSLNVIHQFLIRRMNLYTIAIIFHAGDMVETQN